jgi:hypothetical protein
MPKRERKSKEDFNKELRLSGFEKSSGFPVHAVGVAKKKEETS